MEERIHQGHWSSLVPIASCQLVVVVIGWSNGIQVRFLRTRTCLAIGIRSLVDSMSFAGVAQW